MGASGNADAREFDVRHNIVTSQPRNCMMLPAGRGDLDEDGKPLGTLWGTVGAGRLAWICPGGFDSQERKNYVPLAR